MVVQTTNTMYTYITQIVSSASDLALYKKLDGEEASARIVATVPFSNLVKIIDDNRGQ